MKEEQLLIAFIIAGLIAGMLCTGLSPEESMALRAWAQELRDNQLLVNDLTDYDSLNVQIIDFHKYNKAAAYDRLQQRIFGH